MSAKWESGDGRLRIGRRQGTLVRILPKLGSCALSAQRQSRGKICNGSVQDSRKNTKVLDTSQHATSDAA